MCHWSIMNTRMPQQQTQMPCKIIMEINQPRQEIYSCPYHDRIGINQGEKKLLTGSQRLWKKLFISSEWDAGVCTRNLCFMVSEEPQFVLVPRTYSHSHCGPGVKLFSEDRVLALRDIEAPAPAQDVLLCSMLLQETFAWRKCVRLHSVSCCTSQRFPSTGSAFVLQVLGVTAEVSGATAMKYWNWVSERNLFQLSSGSKAGYCGLMNYPVFAEQHVSLHKRWDKATLEKVYFIKV